MAYEGKIAELSRVIESLKETIRFKSARFKQSIQQNLRENRPVVQGCDTTSYEVEMWVDLYKGQSSRLLKSQDDLVRTAAQLHATKLECTRLRKLISRDAGFDSLDADAHDKEM